MFSRLPPLLQNMDTSVPFAVLASFSKGECATGDREQDLQESQESQKVMVAKEHNTASGRFAIFLVAKGEEEKVASGEF